MQTLKITLLVLSISTGLYFGNHQVQFVQKMISMFPTFGLFSDAEEDTPTREKRIQVALLLDTSSSMNGLIEQTKSQLWNILNSLGQLGTQDQSQVRLEVALYEYGNPTKGIGQINQLSVFSEDMDQISQLLFSLTTNGGSEHCGEVIQRSVLDLDWSPNMDDLKVIYIAGNESFNQGPVPFSLACTQAKHKDIAINTIFCGSSTDYVIQSWQNGAIAGNGVCLNIDQNQSTTYIATPYDDEINQLNQSLNKTYIPFGAQGATKSQNQFSQDANAASYSKANAVDRALFKSSNQYRASDWDLVDACEKDKKIIQESSKLPSAFKSLSEKERKQKVEEMKNERKAIQKKMKDLDQKRKEYQKQQVTPTENGLEKAIFDSIEKEAKKKGFEKKE